MLTVAFVVAGWAAIFVLLVHLLGRTSARIRIESQKQIEALSARVADLEHMIAITRALRPAHATRKDVAAASVAALVSERVLLSPVTKPQTLHPLGDPWAQQGRAGVQSSHDIAQRGH
jgi:hypothetical protein